MTAAPAAVRRIDTQTHAHVLKLPCPRASGRDAAVYHTGKDFPCYCKADARPGTPPTQSAVGAFCCVLLLPRSASTRITHHATGPVTSANKFETEAHDPAYQTSTPAAPPPHRGLPPDSARAPPRPLRLPAAQRGARLRPEIGLQARSSAAPPGRSACFDWNSYSFPSSAHMPTASVQSINIIMISEPRAGKCSRALPNHVQTPTF